MIFNQNFTEISTNTDGILTKFSAVILMKFHFNKTPFYGHIYICSAQSENRYNSGIVLRKVGILTLSGKVGILTLRSAIPELLVRKVGIGTK